MDPIYYPLEMPISAEPFTLPKIEIGHPMYKEKCCNEGINLDNILLLLDKYDKPEPPVYPQPQPIYMPPPPPPRQRLPSKKKKERTMLYGIVQSSVLSSMERRLFPYRELADAP